jgi:DNA-binding transcriptional regulator LsrR (DeoR family)
MNLLMNNWSPHQAEVLYWVMEDQNATQNKIAKRLNIFQSNIAKRLQIAHWKEMEKAMKYIAKELQKA